MSKFVVYVGKVLVGQTQVIEGAFVACENLPNDVGNSDAGRTTHYCGYNLTCVFDLLKEKRLWLVCEDDKPLPPKGYTPESVGAVATRLNKLLPEARSWPHLVPAT